MITPEGYQMGPVVGHVYYLRCLNCGMTIEDNSSGQWTSVHTAWHDRMLAYISDMLGALNTLKGDQRA